MIWLLCCIRVSEGVCVLQVVNVVGVVGFWDLDMMFYMVELLDMIGSCYYEVVVFVGLVWFGKIILLIDVCLVYLIICNLVDVMVVQMFKDVVEDYSKICIVCSIVVSLELCFRLSLCVYDDNILLKFFWLGMLLCMGWLLVLVLLGKDIYDVLMMDVDNYIGDLIIDECFGFGLKCMQIYMFVGMVVVELSLVIDYVDGVWKFLYLY